MMPFTEAHGEQLAGFDALRPLIDDARTVVLCAHTRPDGDALGSQLALASVLRDRWGDDKDVVCLLADDGPIPAAYRFLPGSDALVEPSTYTGDPDLFIALDLPTPERLAAARPVMERSAKVAVIDHHPSSAPFGEPHIVRTGAAATGVLVAELAMYLGVDLGPDAANCLFCAVQTDTGRFQYQNADPESFKIASYLVDSGADPSWVSLNVYQSFRLPYLHLESVVMGRVATLDEGRIAYSYATRADLERTGARDDECDGLVDVVRSVRGSEAALFLKESPVEGTIRGNLRSKGSADVSAVARAMGGGGHRAAAGFSAQGTVDEVFAKVFPLLKDALAQEEHR